MARHLSATRVQGQLPRLRDARPAPYPAASRPSRSQPPQQHAATPARDASLCCCSPATSLVQRPAAKTARTRHGRRAGTGTAGADGRLPGTTKRLLVWEQHVRPGSQHLARACAALKVKGTGSTEHDYQEARRFNTGRE